MFDHSVNVDDPPSWVGIPVVGPEGHAPHHVLLIAVTAAVVPPITAVLFAVSVLKVL
jgi:hypothetical protein